MRRFTVHWRAILARLPLPTLSLAAAYGVYSFQALFVPWWVAIVSATSFELVYLGLAVARLDAADRRRATLISIGAVVVSVLYNSLSALFAIRPALLVDRPLWADVALAVAHGLPLAVVAFLVADLLLHTAVAPAAPHPAPTTPPASPQAVLGDPLAALREEARRLRSEGASWAHIAAAVGRSPSTVREWLAASHNGVEH
jgi:Homeodomain-like domain